MDFITLFLVLIVYIILTFVLASAAKKKGRSYGAFLLLGLFISPIIGFIILIALGENKEEKAKQEVSQGIAKKCPFCANTINREAVVCQFCGRDLPKVENIPAGKIFVQHSGKTYAVISATKIFYERDINSEVLEDLDVGDQVFQQYEVKDGQITWVFIKAFGVEGWCKAECLKEC